VNLAPRWNAGTWTNPPAAQRLEGESLVVTATSGTDAWRLTAHGYVTDDAHALLAPLSAGAAVEVSFVAELTEQFDQAGLMLRAGPANWIKAGAEFADGSLQLGAVVTRDYSDWSSTSRPDWAGREITIQATHTGDAVVIRAGVDNEPLRMIRLCWVDPSLEYSAGPYLCAPTRAGLEVRFTRWVEVPADATVHPDGLPDWAS
jgi:regulation of enolase protein 1 (concanavalin A-like superfamily)